MLYLHILKDTIKENNLNFIFIERNIKYYVKSRLIYLILWVICLNSLVCHNAGTAKDRSYFLFAGKKEFKYNLPIRKNKKLYKEIILFRWILGTQLYNYSL